MPSISKVKISNMALSHIGARSTIESMDEDSSEANSCNLWYDWARVQALEAHNWDFARKRVGLGLIGTDPTVNWQYRYGYPSDCILTRHIENPSGWTADAIPFEVELNSAGTLKTILTDQETAEMVYTMDLQNTALFTPLFVDAISWRLAAAIAFSLTGDGSIEEKALSKFYLTLSSAAARNAGGTLDRVPLDSEFIRGRE